MKEWKKKEEYKGKYENLAKNNKRQDEKTGFELNSHDLRTQFLSFVCKGKNKTKGKRGEGKKIS